MPQNHGLFVDITAVVAACTVQYFALLFFETSSFVGLQMPPLLRLMAGRQRFDARLIGVERGVFVSCMDDKLQRSQYLVQALWRVVFLL